MIVAGVGVTSGALSNDIYTAIIIMVAATTIITPIWLKLSYKDEPLEPTASTRSSSPESALLCTIACSSRPKSNFERNL